MKKDKNLAKNARLLRVQAEKALEKYHKNQPDISSMDTIRLLEELNIHQIELEMQNQDLRESQEKLEESRNKYSDLYDFSPIGYFTFDKFGKILDLNLTGAVMLGLERSRLVGTLFSTYIGKKEKGILHEHSREVLRSGKKKTCEIQLVRKDGSCFFAGLESIAIQNVRGDFSIWRSAISDITERKKAEKEKEKLSHQLIQSEKMAGIGTLTAGIAHEFNNLLQILRGHSEFALQTKRPEDIEVALDTVVRTSDRVSKIIQDLIAFSKNKTLEKEACNVIEELEKVLSLIEDHLKKVNVRVIRNYEKIPRILANKAEIQQVFLNIVTNARDSMLPKGGKLTIGIKKAENYIELSFSDTGKGIEAENIGKVFEPFYTTKGAVGGDKRIQGVGLGLSVSYRIVDRHGGAIEVESELGKGTNFKVRLPAQIEDVKDRIVEEKKTVRIENIKPMNILVLDDEEEICKMLTMWLSAEGHKVKSELSGEKGLNLFKKENFNVVLLDIVMPGIAAIDILKEIKEISPKTSVFMMTGKLVDIDLWKELKEKGASGYLQKPFKIEDVNNYLANIRD